jgi:crotonobetainyl-CoA:carnitine CoA-transferase CaiB-like acyl-CoA transferase
MPATSPCDLPRDERRFRECESRRSAYGAPNRRPYRTSDGYIAVLIYNDKHWSVFIEGVRPVWASDLYNTLERRARQIDTVYALLAETLQETNHSGMVGSFPRTSDTRSAPARPGSVVPQ